MSVKQENLATKSEVFQFSEENLLKVEKILGAYPKDRQASAVMPLLHLAQEQEGFVTLPAMDYIADLLKMRRIHVYEVANFYTMYNLAPVGKYLIQICRTTPCWLCGSNDILQTCKKVLGIDIGETTQDGLFTLKEVECLGACTNAPAMQINNDYYEKLNNDKVEEIISRLKSET